MNAQLAEILAQGQIWSAAFWVVFFRIGAAMAILPAVGERSVPVRVRLAITLVYSFVVAGAVQSDLIAVEMKVPDLLATLSIEVLFGLALGFGLRALVFALHIAASMVAQSTSLSQVFGGAVADPQPAIGHLLLAAGMALAVTLGLHVQIAQYLIYSYEILPATTILDPADFSNWGVAQASKAFTLAFSLAAPFVLASLIYNVALGAINKAMPQLMVSFVGAPAITAGGLLLLFICTPLMLTVWQSALDGFLQSPFAVPK